MSFRLAFSSIALVTLGGCSLIFGSDSTSANDAGDNQTDASGGDGMRDAPPQIDAPANSQRIFVTAGLHSGSFGGVAGADTLCNSEAFGIPGDFLAWISEGADPSTRIGGTGPWIVGTDSVIAFADRTALEENTPAVPLNFDSAGAELETVIFWTGTLSNRMPSQANCNAWTNIATTMMGTVGNGESSTWTNSSDQACSNSARILCVETRD